MSTNAFAPVFEDLFDDHRYKVYYGGRGSGKSWAFARALLIKSLERKVRILCCRELQSSIADSVHKLLQDQITAMSMEHRFIVTKQAIFGRNGSEFIFKGLRHNAAEIKSTEGIDIAWCEEAQSVSEASWNLLIPTIRKEGSEIWVSFNPDGIDDPTYQRFVVSPPKEAFVCKVNYDANEWFPDVLRAEMEHCRETDPDAYDNVWLGNPKVAGDAQVFKGKYVVEEFDTPGNVRFYHGADWGFATDPSALVRCWIRNDELYIDYEAVGYHVDIEDTPALFDRVPTARKWPIIADSARPETINHMANKGFNIQACTKWRGGIEDGISVIRSFRKIHIHPRCPTVLQEFKMYSYKQDHLTGEVLPVVLGCYDHCIAAGQTVATRRGGVPIESVTVGDEVMTRFGWRMVLSARKTGDDREVVMVESEFGSVACTPDHRVFTTNRGFVEAGTLTSEDELVCLPGRRSNTTAHESDFVVGRVLRVARLEETATVYDLEVQGEHEFFAGGILVHNCIDSLRYALEAVIRGRRTIRLSKGVTDQMSRNKMIRNGFSLLRRGMGTR